MCKSKLVAVSPEDMEGKAIRLSAADVGLIVGALESRRAVVAEAMHVRRSEAESLRQGEIEEVRWAVERAGVEADQLGVILGRIDRLRDLLGGA